jgi:hypothetical protein
LNRQDAKSAKGGREEEEEREGEKERERERSMHEILNITFLPSLESWRFKFPLLSSSSLPPLALLASWRFNSLYWNWLVGLVALGPPYKRSRHE